MRPPRCIALLLAMLISALLCAPVASAWQHYSSCQTDVAGLCREVQQTTGLVLEIVWTTDEGIEVIVTYGVGGTSSSAAVKLCYRNEHGPWISSTGNCDATPQAGDPVGVPSYVQRTSEKALAFLDALA